MNMNRRYHSPRNQSGLNGTIDLWNGSREILADITREICKKALCISLISIMLLFVMSCAPLQSRLVTTEILKDEELAQHTLMDFLGNLHHGRYDEAARSYGGDYETMIDHNPDIDPNDHAVLLRYACTRNGVQCLQWKIIGLEEKVSDARYVFIVEFLKDDGTLFVLGPCCGGNEKDIPPQSVFLFTVIKVGQNEFAVLDMPPYAP